MEQHQAAMSVQVRKTIQLQWLCTGRNRMSHVFIDRRVVTNYDLRITHALAIHHRKHIIISSSIYRSIPLVHTSNRGAADARERNKAHRLTTEWNPQHFFCTHWDCVCARALIYFFEPLLPSQCIRHFHFQHCIFMKRKHHNDHKILWMPALLSHPWIHRKSHTF